MKSKTNSKRQDMQYMIQNKTQVETVNLNDFISKSSSDRMKYNTLQHIYIYNAERESICHVGGKKDYPSEAKHDKEISKN